MMKLITKEMEGRFSEVGYQTKSSNPIVVAKFFNPVGSQTWYATEFDPETKICYGYVTGMTHDGDEWGYFSVAELESVRLPYGNNIERDIFFKEIRFDSLMRQLCREMFPGKQQSKNENDLEL